MSLIQFNVPTNISGGSGGTETFASNGLTKIGDYVTLGGTLTGDTTIDGAGSNKLNFTSINGLHITTTSTDGFSVLTPAEQSLFSGGTFKVNSNVNGVRAIEIIAKGSSTETFIGAENGQVTFSSTGGSVNLIGSVVSANASGQLSMSGGADGVVIQGGTGALALRQDGNYPMGLYSFSNGAMEILATGDTNITSNNMIINALTDLLVESENSMTINGYGNGGIIVNTSDGGITVQTNQHDISVNTGSAFINLSSQNLVSSETSFVVTLGASSNISLESDQASINFITNTIQWEVTNGSSTSQSNISPTSTSIQCGDASITSLLTLSNTGYDLTFVDNGSGFYNAVEATTSDAINIIATDASFKGILYNNDYSGNFVNRSLVDKQYVDTAVSDERLKQNITGLTNSLNRINALKPVEFDFIKSKEHTAGFIAQDMDKVFPELVVKDGEFWRIKNQLIPYLVKAIQELSAKVDDLQNKLNQTK